MKNFQKISAIFQTLDFCKLKLHDDCKYAYFATNFWKSVVLWHRPGNISGKVSGRNCTEFSTQTILLRCTNWIHPLFKIIALFHRYADSLKLYCDCMAMSKIYSHMTVRTILRKYSYWHIFKPPPDLQIISS